MTTRRLLPLAVLLVLPLLACGPLARATLTPTLALLPTATEAAPTASPTPPATFPPATSTLAPTSTPRPAVSPTVAPPAGPTRIQFARGAVSAQVSGHLPPGGSHTYVLRALGGQTMMARLLPPSSGDPKAILVIYAADGSVLISDHALATQWEGVLPSTQDYFIDVRCNPNTPHDYTLEVIIPPLATPTPESGLPTRIQFAPGAISAHVTGHLDPSQMRTFVVRALAGQTMRAQLLPPPSGEPTVILTIHGADGSVLISDHALATEWEGVLPITQDYFIDVRANPSTPVDFTLEVTIPPLVTPVPGGSEPVRIQFAPGAISAHVEGHLEPAQAQRYVLRALAGQTMWVLLLPPPAGDPAAILVIWGADGTVLISDHALATMWGGTLPSTQDYYIDVEANPSNPVDYTLEVIVLSP
jgi:hypothetical protein